MLIVVRLQKTLVVRQDARRDNIFLSFFARQSRRPLSTIRNIFSLLSAKLTHRKSATDRFAHQSREVARDLFKNYPRKVRILTAGVQRFCVREQNAREKRARDRIIRSRSHSYKT